MRLWLFEKEENMNEKGEIAEISLKIVCFSKILLRASFLHFSWKTKI